MRCISFPSLIFFASLFAFTLAAIGQTNAPPQLRPRPTTPPPGGGNEQIILDVQVTDKSGAPIRGLENRDFTLLDANQPQSILSFQAIEGGTTPDQPVEMVLVIDSVNTPFRAISFERDQIRKFLLQNAAKLLLPTSLVLFSETGTRMQTAPSRDGNVLAGLLDQYEGSLRSGNLTNGGHWGAAESVQMSLKALLGILNQEAQRPGRKLLIWFSRGWPVAGQGGVRTERETQQLFDWITSVSAALQQSRVTLYSIDALSLRNAGSIRNSYYETFLKPATSASRAQPGDLGLPVIAVQSGGRVFNSSGDITAALERCVADAGYSYALSFAAPRAAHADEYHPLEVKIDKPWVTVRTRFGYYAQP
ncbi:MAG: VWA domain-containing protein [Terriglobales bacterium]